MSDQRLFSVLELVATRDHPVTVAEMATAGAVPRPTMHRWLASLTGAGLLQRALNGRAYELGPDASRLAFTILGNRPGAAMRHAILQRVAHDVKESCNLTVLHGSQVTYLDRVESMWPLRITFQPGSQVPVHCSASGKLFLALMTPKKRGALLQSLPLDRYTGNTLVDHDRLLQDLRGVRKLRYALDDEEYVPGLVCLAVPIMQRVGRARLCVAALAIQAPVSRLNSSTILGRLPTLQAAALAVAATLA